jgi:hypothetical protein
MINVFILNASDDWIKAVARSLRLSKQKNITLWIERAWVGEPPYNNWKDKHVIDDRVGALTNLYFEWNVDNQVAQALPNEMRSMWWRMKHQQLDFCILTNQPQPKSRKVMFEDSRTDENYPKGFEVIRCFNDYDSLMNYCKEQGAVTFSLHDTCFFKHEHDIVPYKGAEVYREIATGRLWYRDTFHKDHYEIFDYRGRNHVAEADMDGIVDTSKADPKKNPIVR